MLCMLVAYDANGSVVATLDSMVARDEDGTVIGLIDFAAHEAAGGRLRDIWENEEAVGSGAWPEWLGSKAHDFKVELDPSPGPARARITALIHKQSGHHRSRADIEAALAERINEKKRDAKKAGDVIRDDLRKRGVKEELIALVQDPKPEPVDARDLLGGPSKPLLLDDDGKTMKRQKVERPNLPIVGKG